MFYHLFNFSVPCPILVHLMLLLFAIIRSVLKSFKVPNVEVVAARMSNESALTCMADSTPKNRYVSDADGMKNIWSSLADGWLIGELACLAKD